MRLSKNVVGASGVASPSLTLGWRHDFGDREVEADYRYQVAESAYTGSARSVTENSRDAVVFGAAVSLAPANVEGFALNFSYNGAAGSKRVEHSFFGGVEIWF
jgi:hypothetical protein